MMIKRTVAMTLLGFALLLSMSACAAPGASAPNDNAAPPPATSPSELPDDGELVALCVPNSFNDGFVTLGAVSAALPDTIGADLVNLLVDARALPTGVELISLDVDQELGEITVNMNSAYGHAVSSSEGTPTEYALVGAVVNTLINYYDAQFVFIKVEGTLLATSFAEDAEAPLNFFPDKRTHYSAPLELGQLPDTIESLPNPDAQENLYRYLSGYWNSSKGDFVGFITRCGLPYVEFGIWDSDFMRIGSMTSVKATGDLSVDFNFLLKAEPGNELNDGYPEQEITMAVDLSSFANNGKIKAGDKSEGKLSTFTHAGLTFQDAYDAAH